MKKIPYGYCHCGCGKKTNIAKQTDKLKGWIKGTPLLYIRQHHARGKRSTNWKGGKFIDSYGYVFIYAPKNNRADHRGYVREHIMIAERILRKPLPAHAVVHHINGKPGDNRKNNLIICENNSYHIFLHRREVAKKECGNPSWRQCWICKQYDKPENLYINPSCQSARHRPCYNTYQNQRR